MNQLLQQALDALIASRMYVCCGGSDEEIDANQAAIYALKAELAESEPEPVAWVHVSKYKLPGVAQPAWLSFSSHDENSLSAVPLYAEREVDEPILGAKT